MASQNQNQSQQNQTFGQQTVRLYLNPTNNERLQNFKQELASFIDELQSLKQQQPKARARRQASKAIVDFESAIGHVEEFMMASDVSKIVEQAEIQQPSGKRLQQQS